MFQLLVHDKTAGEANQRIVGENHLLNFGHFLEDYNVKTSKLSNKLNSNLRICPVLMDTERNKNVDLKHRIYCPNKILTRILLDLVAICDEGNTLINGATEYYRLILNYNERSEIPFGRFNLETVHKLDLFIQRCSEVIQNILLQLSTLFTNTKKFHSINYSELLEVLSEIILCVLTIETLIASTDLKEKWNNYRKRINYQLCNPRNISIESYKLGIFCKYLDSLQSNVITEHLFQVFLEKSLHSVAMKANISEPLTKYMIDLLTQLESNETQLNLNQFCLKCNIVYVVTFYIYRNVDKKVIYRLIEANKKITICHLYGGVSCYPEEFLLKYVPDLTKIIDINVLKNERNLKLTTCNQTLSRDVQNIILYACYWMLEINNTAQKNVNSTTIESLKNDTALIIDGLKMINKSVKLVNFQMNGYTDSNKPITKSTIISLSKLLEIIKSVEIVFFKIMTAIVESIALMQQQVTRTIFQMLTALRSYYLNDKSSKEYYLDSISNIDICLQCLEAKTTNNTILLTKLAAPAFSLKRVEIKDLKQKLNELDVLNNLSKYMVNSCQCDFLHRHQNYVAPVYMSKMLVSNFDISRYYLMVSALQDCAVIFQHQESDTTNEILKNDLISPINQTLESNLRFETHAHLEATPPFTLKDYTFLQFSKFLPVLTSKVYTSVIHEAEHFLSTTFYNLTTVILHDWKTYGQMRQLAYFQYGLRTVEDKLPLQQLEQGLDVLEVMRNIDNFVTTYCYNLNNQIFIEQQSVGKYLNTLNITHVANSIRTHGIGIVNTAVNYTYQFLQEKMYAFSQFMFDEHIKAHLLREKRFFMTHKCDINQMYPYERAEKFNSSIRNLNADGMSCLDRFRQLIGLIGNAIGYIRLIRSGGRRFLANSAAFILDDEAKFEKLNCLQLSETTTAVVTGLTKSMNTVLVNCDEITEYFQLLIKVFQEILNSDKYLHLKNFFILIPPLTVNFIEYSLTFKENLNKNINKAMFTDDGFAMGLAYFIELLEQEDCFQSINWFKSVHLKIKTDRLIIQDQRMKATKLDDKLQQTLKLSEKRVNLLEREFQLLEYNLTSARFFFKS